MRHRIAGVDEGSIAEELGIRPGDELVSINGRDVADLIDYQAFCAEEEIVLRVLRGGEEMEYEFEKDEYEPLGLTFDRPLMSRERSCANRCLFCFEEQNPRGVRDTLHSRDDDWRLSLMTGSYITLTNVGERELERIIARHASPLYISVHVTDSGLREKLMGNPRAGRILEQLNRLKSGGISFHTQAVVCPGINDGEMLEKTIHDLAALQPAALSMAVVPAGITWHREGEYPLRNFTRDEARAVLDTCRRWRAICRKYFGTAFVHPADEFYLLAGEPIPTEEEYEGYEQIENGVGMLRLLEEEYAAAFDLAKERGELGDGPAGRPLMAVAATGTAAGPFLRDLLAKRPVPGVDVRVHPCTNFFFGDSVNVAGLLTGRDLLHEENGLRGLRMDALLVTECMLREGEELLLDDMTVDDLSRELGVPVIVVRRGGEGLFDAQMQLRKQTKV